MTFADLNFILRLIPIFLLIYYLAPAKVRPWLLLVGSLGFYYVNEPMLIIVMAAGAVLNFLLALINFKKRNKIILAIAIILDVLWLGAFKASAPLHLGLLIPLGLSYFVFKLISYQVDLFKGKVEKLSFVNYLVYLFMFPQVIAGPIARYDYVISNKYWAKREGSRRERFGQILCQLEEGLKLFAIGLFFKVMVADHIAVLWNELKTIGYESISTPLAWIGAYSYSLNLYFDFWGYSLMAAGLGIMLGFEFIINFDQPYFAASISDFYRKWHSTLGTWFRDYIYFPLGGNRKGKLRTVFNLIIVWAVTGIWHGSTLNFLIWAGVLCLIIIFEKLLLSKAPKLFKVVGHLNVWLIIPVTWVIFAIHSLKDLRLYLLRMFPVINVGVAVNAKDFRYSLMEYGVYLVLGLIFVMPFVTNLYRKHKDNVFVVLMIFVMFWVSIFSLSNSAGNPFMYLRF
ncbi:MAG: MBOAT family protein [Pseudobutyrivibrio sp.]|nr:MBOAT family protein [Pseudobutyrivibrio sp.]